MKAKTMELGFRELQERDNPQTVGNKLRAFYWRNEADINGVILFSLFGAVWASGMLVAFMVLGG